MNNTLTMGASKGASILKSNMGKGSLLWILSFPDLVTQQHLKKTLLFRFPQFRSWGLLGGLDSIHWICWPLAFIGICSYPLLNGYVVMHSFTSLHCRRGLFCVLEFVGSYCLYLLIRSLFRFGSVLWTGSGLFFLKKKDSIVQDLMGVSLVLSRAFFRGLKDPSNLICVVFTQSWQFFLI